MPTVTYVETDGTERRVDVPNGTSLMLGAVKNNIRGIDAECGGACSCATCHIYVDPSWLGRLSPVDDMEDEMLQGCAAVRLPESRLSCQIEVQPGLDGLVVRVPDRQY